MGKFFKRTTILSAISMLMCIVTFLMTGAGLRVISAAASVNTVQAGALDVSFEMFVDDAWVNAEGMTMEFHELGDENSVNVIWEPGCTYELPLLRICNNSNLEIKYTVNISGINGDDKLNEVIEWYYVTDTNTLQLGTISGTLTPGAGSELFTIRGHMLESASNAYQGLTIDSISITVAATQEANPDAPGETGGIPYYTVNTDTDLVIDERGSYIVLDDEVQNYLASQNGEKITVSNGTFTGRTYSFMLGQYRSSVYTNFNLEANNIKILDMTVMNGVMNCKDKMSIAVYAYGNTVLNDCVMMGTKSEAEGYEVYDVGFVNRSNCAVNGGKYGAMYIWSQAHVTITGAEVDRILCSTITVRNLGMLTIAEGTHVGTLELNASNNKSYKPGITIEEGAIVDEIIYRGVSYTQDEWLAANP